MGLLKQSCGSYSYVIKIKLPITVQNKLKAFSQENAFFYSYLNATIGSKREAFTAGI